MFDNNNTKDRKGKMEAHYHKFLSLYMKWSNIIVTLER